MLAEIEGQEDAGVFGEGDGDGGDGAGLDDDEEGPAVEESPEASEGFAQVDVLAAGVRHGGGEFAVAEGGDDGEGGADEPAEDEQAGRLHLARDIGADDEDAGADHGAHDERGGVGQAEPFDEAGGGLSGSLATVLLSCCHSAIRSRKVRALQGEGNRSSAMTATESAPAFQQFDALCLV